MLQMFYLLTLIVDTKNKKYKNELSEYLSILLQRLVIFLNNQILCFYFPRETKNQVVFYCLREIIPIKLLLKTFLFIDESNIFNIYCDIYY